MIYLPFEKVKKVNKIAIRHYKILAEQIMELAGKELSDFVYNRFKPKKVLVMYGKWDNGAGGLVCARHLINRGVKVMIVKASRRGGKFVRRRLKTLRRIGVNEVNDVEKVDVIIDALLGYDFKGIPKRRYFELIERANSLRSKGIKIVSLDVPSGINTSTGESAGSYIRADYILTLGMPKKGLENKKNVYLVNIGIPNEVYKSLGININNYFKDSDVVKIS